jgi:hypothetical protein
MTFVVGGGVTGIDPTALKKHSLRKISRKDSRQQVYSLLIVMPFLKAFMLLL